MWGSFIEKLQAWHMDVRRGGGKVAKTPFDIFHFQPLQKRLFFSIEKEKWNFIHFEPHSFCLPIKNPPIAPPEKILPTPMDLGLSEQL